MKRHAEAAEGSISPKRRIYRRATSAAFVDACLTAGRVCFPLDELVDATGLAPSVALKQLRRLAPMVVPVYQRANYFLIVPPEHRLNGAPPVHWWINAFLSWHDEPYYLGLMSAAAQYGSSHQALQTTQIIALRQRNDIAVGRLRVVFVMKKTMIRTQIGSLCGSHAPVRVSSPESTVFDLIRYAKHVGGTERVAAVIDEMKPRLSTPGFRRALQESFETALLQRSGFILEGLGMTAFSELVRDSLVGRRLRPIPIGGLDDDARRGEGRKNPWSVYGAITLRQP